MLTRVKDDPLLKLTGRPDTQLTEEEGKGETSPDIFEKRCHDSVHPSLDFLFKIQF